MTETEVKTMHIVDALCISFFFLEMLVKLIAYEDIFLYITSKVNIFDGFIASVSLLSLFIETEQESNINHSLTTLRVCRLYRVFTVARYWPDIYGILSGRNHFSRGEK
jgi:hypothetical protein